MQNQHISTLGSVFQYIPDKQQACDDLHRLTNDGDSSVRSDAVKVLGSVFSYVPDKLKGY